MNRYLFNQIAIGLNNGQGTASGLGAGTPHHVSVHGVEYHCDGGHQAGLDAIEMFICMFLKFVSDKIGHKLNGQKMTFLKVRYKNEQQFLLPNPVYCF